MKKYISILLFLFCFSAKAQKEESYNSFIIHDYDLYYSLETQMEFFEYKINELIYSNSIKIYADSNLKRSISNSEIKNKVDSIKAQEGHLINLSYTSNSIEYFSLIHEVKLININKNHLKFRSSLFGFIYIQATELESKLNSKNKIFLSILNHNFDAGISLYNLKTFSKKYFRNSMNSLYLLANNKTIDAFHNVEFKKSFTEQDFKELGNNKGVKKNKNMDVFNKSDSIDSVYSIPFQSDFIKNIGIKFSSKLQKNFELKTDINSIFLTSYLIFPEADTLFNMSLFYMKKSDVLKQFSKEDKLLWDLMILHAFRRTINPNTFYYEEDFEN